MDVFRAAVACPDEQAEALFGWLRALPFVDDRSDRLRYHDLVRGQMLRRQRQLSPRDWAEHHERLAGHFGGWCEAAVHGIRPDEVWEHEAWRRLRLERTYHLLCARRGGALDEALRDVAGSRRQYEFMSARAKPASGAASCNVEVFRMGLGQEPPSSGELDAYPATDAG